MSYYWDERFTQHLDIEGVKVVCEVGARYGEESITLSEIFKNSQILSFECNPNTVDLCKEKLKGHSRIKFFDHGLGESEQTLPFYSFNRSNDGASSFFKRDDYDITQEDSGEMLIKTLESVLHSENIPHIDLLCMDVQGYELNVLKGCGEFMKHIDYIIMEQPNKTENANAKYIGAPSSSEIETFMTCHNFVEIVRVMENYHEDNVMYKRVESL